MLRIFGFLKGYIMNYANQEISEYLGTNDRTPEMIQNYPDTTPPFYSMLFKREDFLDPNRHFGLIKGIKTHEDIGGHPGFVPLEGRGFVVGCHGNNISTTYNHPFKGRVLTPKETEAILIKTGILFRESPKFVPSLRLRLRRIVNKLPFRHLLKEWYYKLPTRFHKL